MLAAVHACYSIGEVYLDESKNYTILDTDVRVKCFDNNGDEIIGGHDSIEVEYQVKSRVVGAIIRDIYCTVDATINRLLSDNVKLATYRKV
ncbi:hypothetical protein Tco_1326401 [Tanacetum coccineum]